MSTLRRDRHCKSLNESAPHWLGTIQASLISNPGQLCNKTARKQKMILYKMSRISWNNFMITFLKTSNTPLHFFLDCWQQNTPALSSMQLFFNALQPRPYSWIEKLLISQGDYCICTKLKGDIIWIVVGKKLFFIEFVNFPI